MNRDVMSVRLWLPLIVVLGVVVDAPERLAVRVASSVRRPRCPRCGAPSGTVHDRREQRVRDLEVSGRPATLVWDRRRMVCEPCGRRFVEVHRAFEGRVTARLARRLVADARETAVSAVARRHRVGWHTVTGLAVAYAGLVGEHRRRRRCRVLLVDETSIRKRHRYVTVLAGGDTGETLAMATAPQRGGPVGVPGLAGAPLAQRREGRRLGRFQVLCGGHRQAARPRPPRPGPVPRRQMVRGRADSGAPRCPASPRGIEARVRPRGVPGTVRAHETARHPRRRRAGTPRGSLRDPPPAQGGLGRARRAARPLSRDRPQGRPRSARPVRRHLRQRADTRVQQHSGHLPGVA